MQMNATSLRGAGARGGVLAIASACTIWGLSPLFYKWLTHVPPLELLLHRSLWSLLLFSGLLAIQGRIGALRQAVSSRRAAMVTVFAAAMVSVNWFGFIWAVQAGQTTQTALGYYIFPLVAVLIGVLWLSERLTALQWISVGLAALAVIVMAVGQGAAPWISVILAVTFALYGLVKKGAAMGPVVSVTAECWVLGLPSLAGLIWWHAQGEGSFGQDLFTSAMLILSGFLTAFPLILFSRGAQNVRMATLGLVQYLNPTLQFLCAVVVFAEPFGALHGLAFGLIWLALALYSVAAFRQEKARRKSAVTASVVSAD